MARAFNLPIGEFKKLAGGIRWLDLADNQRLFGTANPGVLFKNFTIVGDVLRRNRPGVFQAKPEDYLMPSFIRSAQ